MLEHMFTSVRSYEDSSLIKYGAAWHYQWNSWFYFFKAKFFGVGVEYFIHLDKAGFFFQDISL